MIIKSLVQEIRDIKIILEQKFPKNEELKNDELKNEAENTKCFAECHFINDN